MSPQETKNLKLHAIFNALIDLLQIQPMDSIKISNLCQRAAVSRTYFYNHFSSLDDIIRQAQLADAVKYLRELPDNRKLSLSLTMERYFMLAKRDQKVFLLLYSAGKNQVMIDVFKDVYLYLSKNELLLVKRQSKIANDYWPNFLAGAVVNTAIHWLQTGQTDSPKQMGRLVEAFLVS